ncbi:MAG: hypothetical protein IPP88_02365 [Betaproteobacteria bacterium]|nr:hypothetical protein [Betaproteobacteria bacterium]
MTKTDLEEFDRTYVLAGSMARQFSVNHTNVADKIRDAGVEPVSGPVSMMVWFICSGDRIYDLSILLQR